MSKFILSFCVEPLYVMDSINKAHSCGYYSGLVYCAILSILTGLFLLRKLYTTHDNDKLKPAVIILSSIILVCWIFIPLFVRYSYGNMWIGYNTYIQAFINQGFTRQQAIAMISQITSISDINIGYIQGVSSLILSAKKDKEMKDKEMNDKEMKDKEMKDKKI